MAVCVLSAIDAVDPSGEDDPLEEDPPLEEDELEPPSPPVVPPTPLELEQAASTPAVTNATPITDNLVKSPPRFGVSVSRFTPPSYHSRFGGQT
jgi:hypothetical protein